MEKKIVGKVMYSGPSYKNGLTSGKVYECVGLSHGDVRIIDDEGEAYFYSATNPYRDHKTGKRGEWIVMEDLSDGLLTDFVSGEKNRTPEEEQFEKGKVAASIEIHFGGKDKRDMVKSVSKKTNYVERTPEINKREQAMLESFARSLLPLIKKEAAKHGGKLPTTFEETIEEGAEFDLTKGNNSYKIMYMVDRWDIYKINVVKKEESREFICSFSREQYPQLYKVKLYVAKSNEF